MPLMGSFPVLAGAQGPPRRIRKDIGLFVADVPCFPQACSGVPSCISGSSGLGVGVEGLPCGLLRCVGGGLGPWATVRHL